MGIVDRLLAEHKEIRGLFLDYERAEGEEARGRAFEAVCREVTGHHRGEERALFSRTRKMESLKWESLESIEEHHLLDMLITEMRRLDRGQDHFQAKFKVFHELVEHHFHEEEADQFPKVERDVDRGDLERWTEEYEAEEERAKESY